MHLRKANNSLKLLSQKSIIYYVIFSFSGWINGASLVDKGQKGVAVMFFISGALFLLLALCMVYLLRKVITSCTKAITKTLCK